MGALVSRRKSVQRVDTGWQGVVSPDRQLRARHAFRGFNESRVTSLEWPVSLVSLQGHGKNGVFICLDRGLSFMQRDSEHES
jgi:hypothetical protein